ncbi:hypothetical protein JDV02_009124 [Purpureocillium takamizusanense]|uniref:Uncharacterized protein n=1 Tax=Purpureocillium takamizusanense TaxID=2060973 RepID=A0A9Q8QR78_9HYPO|nr:uncharacterized protein JDV02_009124 [Purpureocillium takamizusanense]UNI23294.1 hypothetical protein JDV02_009124 [Purpureocillium takamizusanense]
MPAATSVKSGVPDDALLSDKERPEDETCDLGHCTLRVRVRVFPRCEIANGQRGKLHDPGAQGPKGRGGLLTYTELAEPHA